MSQMKQATISSSCGRRLMGLEKGSCRCPSRDRRDGSLPPRYEVGAVDLRV